MTHSDAGKNHVHVVPRGDQVAGDLHHPRGVAEAVPADVVGERQRRGGTREAWRGSAWGRRLADCG